MRRKLIPLAFLLLPALAQKLVLGLALEGPALPTRLAGFAPLEQGGNPLWGGVALPLDPAFWEGVPPEGAGFLALVLLRLRVYLEPPGF